LGLIPVLLLKQTESESKSNAHSFSLFQKWKLHKSSFQVIGLFLVIGLLTSTAGGMVVPYLNIYFEDRFHSSKTMIGLIVAMGQGATALALFIGPAVTRRYGEAKSIVVLQLSSVPFLLITAYATGFYWACGGYLFRQALMNASNPYYSSIKMRYVDRSLRGLAASSGEAVYNLGWFCSTY
jgi:predicted MFS family arabinose efflux permease